MSKPTGKCAFCGGPRLTKGHILPESFGIILPSDAKYHEQKIGTFNTFKSDIPGPSKWERIGTGSLQKRRPRNTCVTCNGGWMSLIESAALPVIKPLILGQRSALDLASQEQLASVLTLISMRIELTAHGMQTIPRFEKEALRTDPLPTPNWRIWIARHAGKNLTEYRYQYTAMQIASDPSTPHGAQYCNTHVTTLIAGQLYVHIFFSTVWPEFAGYDGVALCRLWPPTGFDIDTGSLPELSDEAGVMLHETISREGKRPQ
jgi:hypothetical protein